MIENDKYVPILKGKQGEFIALHKLPSEIKNEIIPVIDLVPNNTKKIEDHVQSILRYFSKWEKERLIYVDAYMLDDSILLPDSVHPVKFICDHLISDGYNIVPVLCGVISDELRSVVKNISIKANRGIALRIFVKTIEEINTEIDEILTFLQLSPNKIDLIIDLRSMIEAELQERINFATKIFANLIFLNSWRSITISGGNFPIDLTELTPDQVHPIQRKQWQLWKSIILNNPEIKPPYSDYVISHPSLSELAGDQINASASIRYTHEDNYYVYRGRGTRQHGFEQFFDISETLINSNHFYGIEHCEGDKFINKCATVKDKTGNLTTWRWVCTAHHITVVVNQLRQFFRSLSV